jgi:predicted ATPase
MCHEIPLRFLNVAEVASYIDQEFSSHTFPPGFPSLIHSTTEGNPLFVVEVLGYLPDQGVLARFEGKWILAQSMPVIEKQLPPSISGMIQRKIDRLSDDDRRLLRIGGSGCDFDSAIVPKPRQGRRNVEEQLEKLERYNSYV